MKLMKHVSQRRKSERGIILMMATASLVAIIPLVGLSIDVGYLYACKARIQAAVDGASLAAARALVLGSTTSAQATTAKQNAVNWFYANFPTNNWATRNITMSTSTVDVRDETTDPADPTLRNVRRVEVRAEVDAPSYFMRWFGSRYNYTHLISTGTANRRDVVVMMVLDRSSSMQTTDACDDLRAAAKTFTGQFAAGRDRIGMVSFSDGVSPVYIPSTSFRTSLGFTASDGNGNGAIDQIVCNGGTGTAQAIAVAQREIDRTNLPGALNILLLETDGLPNSLAFDFWDSSRTAPEKSALRSISSTVGCLDRRSTGRPRGWTSGTNTGWDTDTNRQNWSKAGPFYATISGQVTPTPYIASGMIGTIYSIDPGSKSFQALASPWHDNQNRGIAGGTNATNSKYSSNPAPSALTQNDPAGCVFAGTDSNLTDFKRLPRTDLMGNDVKPADAYLSVQLVDNNLANSSSSTAPYLKFACTANPCSNSEINTRWDNFHNAAVNASDHAAFRARAGQIGTNNIGSTVYVIGLGGNSSYTPDYDLMQRWANDPRADQFNGANPIYGAYTMPSSFNSQPRGRLVFSHDFSDLQQAFLEISSQILRLSQ